MKKSIENFYFFLQSKSRKVAWTAMVSVVLIFSLLFIVAGCEKPEVPKKTERTGEKWQWVTTYTGFTGRYVEPAFPCYINVQREDEDSVVAYQVYVCDTLFSKGTLPYYPLPLPQEGALINIKLPHFNPKASWMTHSVKNVGFQTCQDTLAFTFIDYIDAPFYFYSKVK